MYFLAITIQSPGRVKPGGLPGQDLSLCLHSTGSPGITFQLFLFSPNCQYSTKNVPLSLLWDEASCLLEQFSHGAGQQIVLWSHPLGWNHLVHRSLTQLGLPLQQHEKIHWVLNWDPGNSLYFLSLYTVHGSWHRCCCLGIQLHSLCGVSWALLSEQKSQKKVGWWLRILFSCIDH